MENMKYFICPKEKWFAVPPQVSKVAGLCAWNLEGVILELKQVSRRRVGPPALFSRLPSTRWQHWVLARWRNNAFNNDSCSHAKTTAGYWSPSAHQRRPLSWTCCTNQKIPLSQPHQRYFFRLHFHLGTSWPGELPTISRRVEQPRSVFWAEFLESLNLALNPTQTLLTGFYCEHRTSLQSRDMAFDGLDWDI